MNKQRMIDLEAVRLLAQRADLDIPSERAGQVAAILSVWQADAVMLARRMSESRFDALTPVTTFSHGIRSEGDAL
jgi:hypothetical protein